MDVSSSALSAYLSADLLEVCPDLDLNGPDSDYFPGATAQEVACLRLKNSLFKKLNDEVNSDADARCLSKFLASNIRCKEWQLDCRTSGDEELVGTFQQCLDNFFYPGGEPLVQSYFDFMNRGRCGPGASLGANGVDFYTKLFSSKLSATSPEIYKVYIEYISWYSDWCDGELNRLIAFGLPKYTSCSNLSFVRKTRDISRSICTEPSLNMFMQLGLGEIIADRLDQSFGINLSVQPEKNRKLARIGSLDNSLATIDLESASDSVSVRMADTFFPEYLKEILSDLRTPSTRINGEEHTLWMVSTMGNGFTFPLQTAIFACVVAACLKRRGIPISRCDQVQPIWGVFGDDIICPTVVVRDVYRLLELLGFVVNRSKSYTVGPFRESCGADFYQGVNVRGVYAKSLLTQQSRYVLINLLNEWSARHNIPLRRAVGYLRDSVRLLAVPAWENIDSGIRSPAPFGRCWHRGKQRYLYRCYYPAVGYLKVLDDRISTARRPGNRSKRRYFNPSGLKFSFLGGHVRNMLIPLSLKQGERPTYRTRLKVSPFWGPSAEQLLVADGWDFWERWKSASLDNLGLET